MSKHNTSATPYLIGFVLSLLFTLVPYWLVTRDVTSGNLLLFGLALFAVLQVFVQLIFFLHLGKEKRPRWQSIAFASMVLVVVIVVFGSLWIMNNLDYNMMPSHEVDQYIQHEEAITPHEH